MIRHFTAYEPNAWGVCGHKHPTIASAAKCAAKDSRREVREVRGSMIMAAVLVPSRATVSALAVAPKKETTSEPGGCGLPGHVAGLVRGWPAATRWCATCELLDGAGRLCAEATRLAGAAGVRWEVDEISLPPSQVTP